MAENGKQKLKGWFPRMRLRVKFKGFPDEVGNKCTSSMRRQLSNFTVILLQISSGLGCVQSPSLLMKHFSKFFCFNALSPSDLIWVFFEHSHPVSKPL